MSTVLRFLQGYNPNLVNVAKMNNNKNTTEGLYKLYLKKNNKKVSELEFRLFRHEEDNQLNLEILSGNTPNNAYKGQGYGTLLRALATKAGHIAGAKVARQYGINSKSRSLQRLKKDPTATPIPTSTGILTTRLGWRTVSKTGLNTNGRVKGVFSEFYYNKNNIGLVNRYLERSRVKSPGCVRCSIQ
jgi:hypothetical protein